VNGAQGVLLAVMDLAIQSFDAPARADAMRKARDAVAELIESHAKCLALLEIWAVQIDGEWGSCRELRELENDGDLEPEIIEARAIQARIGSAS
jgi:hypothetical protein